MSAIFRKGALAWSILWLTAGDLRAGEWLHGWGGAPTNCSCTRSQVTAVQPSIGAVYPICFYDVDLGAVESAKLAWPSYSKKLESALYGRVRNKRKITIVSSRSAVVWAPKYAQRRIADIWPEIACVGQSGGGTSEGRRKDCVKFIKASVKANFAKSPMPNDIPEPVCQTFLPDPRTD